MKKILLGTLVLLTLTLEAQTWERVADFPAGKHHPITFSLNNKGYSVTGTSSSNVPTTDFNEYDPIADSWKSLPAFPGTGRSFGIGVVSKGIAYIGFGASQTRYLNDLWSYDGHTNKWKKLADCGCAGRRHPAMINIGNRIYVGLGDNGSGDQKDWWMYDIENNTWSSIADLPGPSRHHPFMFNSAGRVFAGLGHSGPNIYRDWYELDTATNTWSAKTIFPGEGRVAGTQFSLNDYGYVLSGDGDNHSYMPTGEMWQYDPFTDVWERQTPHPGLSRWAPGSFVINNEVYFMGGLNRFTNVFPVDMYKFNLANAVNNKQLKKFNASIYPNPANDILNWTSDIKIVEVKVYNSLNQLVLAKKGVSNNINITSLKSGLYIVQLYGTESKILKTSKIFVQH